ncbi:MAG: hypothetical protein IJO45_05270 [Oscillospiraceae bacterium]|nr:hypothetical protein [Oscillospiraceae bacterium]
MKARSIIRITITILLLAALTLMFSIPVAASSTILTTSVPSSFVLSLEIEGKGTVTVNSVAYTKTNALVIPRNTATAVQVQPDKGYYLKSVIYNSEDITLQLKDGMVTLPAPEQDSCLRITFTVKATGPITGDAGYYTAGIAGTVMVLSLLCLAMLLANRKKKHSN